MYDVPDVPGVPAISFAPSIDLGIDLLDADGILGFIGFGSQWGVYLNGFPVVIADSVVDFSLKKEWAISDYQVEEGGFGSYDKVYLPYDARVRFAAGGSITNRALLLDSIDAIAGDLNVYDVVVPETVYTSVNVVHYDFRRTSQNGVGLLLVDVWLQQVNVITGGTPSFQNTQAPSGADQANGGTVQGVGASASQAAGGVTAIQSSTPTPVAPDAGQFIFDGEPSGIPGVVVPPK